LGEAIVKVRAIEERISGKWFLVKLIAANSVYWIVLGFYALGNLRTTISLLQGFEQWLEKQLGS